ncbi:VWA domain-containing protein [Pseudomonas sp. HR96]|uniref:VWA domain-containing protein n=1 Tax=Pseudomonas sp. HR96 TaxID=1027966 RepID=UPI002A765040|nr:VWA domain-containing protein [Pseudomonas sp. HR96]WPO98098.1 VWA domain-containing protein [Pseudomonas sp. HR96]
MWQLDHPWLLALTLLAWPAWRYLPDYRERQRALRVPFFNALSQAVGQTPKRQGLRRHLVQLGLNLLVWLLLVIALSRPVWVQPPLLHQQPTRDLMLAIDISQSMETRDYSLADGSKVDRLSAVKQVVQGFIQQRKDDRLGLIVFGSGAFAQAPLTLDHASLALLLEQVGIGMAGPNTALGDAIGLTMRLLEHAPERDKVLILLTDGNDTSSRVAPLHAASMAAAAGIVVHTIGIGDPAASGDAKVDLDGLAAIATRTGGRFFRAEDSRALQQVYQTLDQITPHQVSTLSHQPKRDLFWLPLGAAMLLLGVFHGGAALRVYWRRARPLAQET